jgi:hypothetical protein
MSAIPRVLVPSLLCALLPSVMLCRTSGTVQYVGGTVEAIPVNAAGTFNFDDARELQFNYGGSIYKLPYQQITSMDIKRAELRRVHHVPVPSVFPSHWRDVLSISYKDPAGATGTLKFEMPTLEAINARDSIDQKKAPAGESTATSQNNQWWGDSYWKTTRNKAAWDAQNKQASQAPQPPPGVTN